MSTSKGYMDYLVEGAVKSFSLDLYCSSGHYCVLRWRSESLWLELAYPVALSFVVEASPHTLEL